MASHGHAKADARHIHLHRVVFDKLRESPEIVGSVVELIDRWLSADPSHPSRVWLFEWREMLTTWEIDRIAERVLHATDGQVLRQSSPLASVLTPQERWAALDDVNQRLASDDPNTSASVQ